MPAQVFPSPSSTNDLRKPSLRGEANLGHTDDADATTSGPELSRAEFDILLDFLDTDSNGKVSALELADFVDNLLSTQEHSRPQGSLVFEAVLTAALRYADDVKDACEPGGEAGPQPGQRPPPPPPLAPPLPGSTGADASPPGGKWTAADGDSSGGSVKRGRAKEGDGAFGKENLPSRRLLQGSGNELTVFANTRYLSMDSVQKCFADLLGDCDLWVKLAGQYSVMTTALFRQLLQYSAGGLEKKFSFKMFVKTYGAFNTLPLWLPFPSLWRKRGQHGILFSVYLHQLAKLHQQIPWLTRRVDPHAALVVLTFLQFTASYVPVIAFFAAHGIPAFWHVSSAPQWLQWNPLPDQITFFGSVMPLAVLQFLTSSGALKLSCRDFVNLKDQCKAIFLLGDVASEFDDYPGLTLRAVMDKIKGCVEVTVHSSGFYKVNHIMPLLFGIGLELFRRLVRLFLVGNWVAREHLGPIVTGFEMYALMYNIWFAYSESAACTSYLFYLKKTSNTFRALLIKEEALSQALPWLNNHSPRNLLLWVRLRRYYQSPNCLELRWIEMHLTLVVVAAIAVTIILIITVVQGQLLKFTDENADLQQFVVWVIPAFIYLLAAVVIDVIMSASTGAEYHDAVMTLSAEAVAIADRLNNAEELAKLDGGPDSSTLTEDLTGTDTPGPAPAQGGPASAGPSSSPLPRPRSGASEAGSASGLGSSAARSMRRRAVGLGAGSGNEQALLGPAMSVVPGGELGGWRPADHCRLTREERSKLRQCQEVIKSLVSYIQFNAEYITLFGVPIDTHLRNTLFSVSVTLVGAGISAFLAVIIRR